MNNYFSRRGGRRDVKRAERRILMIERTVAIYLATMGLYGLIAIFSHHPGLHIRDIAISGARSLSGEHIEAVADSVLRTETLRLIRNDSKLWYPKEKIAAAVYAMDDHIRDIQVDHSAQTLEIRITEEIPSLLWCGNTVPERLPESFTGCFMANEKGLIFAEAPEYRGRLFPIYYSSAYATSTPLFPRAPRHPIGHLIAREDIFKKVREVESALISGGLSPIAFGLTEEKELRLFTREEVTVDIRLDQDLSPQIRRFQALLEGLKKEHGEQADHLFHLLERIDLRFEGKVFYEYRE